MALVRHRGVLTNRLCPGETTLAESVVILGEFHEQPQRTDACWLLRRLQRSRSDLPGRRYVSNPGCGRSQEKLESAPVIPMSPGRSFPSGVLYSPASCTSRRAGCPLVWRELPRRAANHVLLSFRARPSGEAITGFADRWRVLSVLVAPPAHGELGADEAGCNAGARFRTFAKSFAPPMWRRVPSRSAALAQLSTAAWPCSSPLTLEQFSSLQLENRRSSAIQRAGRCRSNQTRHVALLFSES